MTSADHAWISTAPGADAAPSDARYRLLLCVLFATAAVIGLWRLGTPSLWLDEAVSWFNSGGAWQHLAERVLATDDIGGLVYAPLLKLWMAVAGQSEFALRLPSVCAMLALLAVMVRTARLIWGRRAALAVGTITLLHPSVISSSREARGYILVLLFSAVCLLGLAWQYLERRRAGLLLGLASLAVTATQMFGIFVAAGIAAAAATLAWQRASDRPTEALAAAARALLPFVPAVLFAVWWRLTTSPVVQARMAEFWTGGSVALNSLVVFTLMVLPVLAGGLVILATDDPTRRRAVAAALVIVATPVFCGPILASRLAAGGYGFVTIRYALPLVLPGTLACGYAVSRLRARLSILLVAVAGCASLWHAASNNVYASASRAGQEIRTGAAFIGSEIRPGEQVVAAPVWEWFSLEYYRVPNVRRPRAPGLADLDAAATGTWTACFRPCPPATLREATGGPWRFGTLTIVVKR